MTKAKKKRSGKGKSTSKWERFKKAYHQWDEGNFELADGLEPDESVPMPPLDRSEIYNWAHMPIKRIERMEVRSFKRLYPILSCVLCLFFMLILLYTAGSLPKYGSADVPAMNEVAERYLEKGEEETGAVNYVAGVILDYRAFDTLGESHVLYAALTAVLILLLDVGDPGTETDDYEDEKIFNFSGDAIVQNTARIIVPIILLFGIYVILNGHLSPGGGFSGGAIIGAGLITYSVAFGNQRARKIVSFKTLKIVSLCALCFYSLSKCYSFFCGANGIESIIKNGTPGNIISAGLILPLNIAVGAVVALTMYSLYTIFKRGKM